jgi:hypothetical protein
MKAFGFFQAGNLAKQDNVAVIFQDEYGFGLIWWEGNQIYSRSLKW